MTGPEARNPALEPEKLEIFIDLIDHLTFEPHAQATGIVLIPVTVSHFDPKRCQPQDVPDRFPSNRPALKEMTTLKNRLLAPELDCLLHEFEERCLAIGQLPA